MKKVVILLFTISVIFFGCSKNSIVSEDKVDNTALSHITNLGYNISQFDVVQRKDKNIEAKLWLIFNSKGDTCGVLLKNGGVWKFSLIFENSVKEYLVFTDEDGFSKVIEEPIDISKIKISMANKKIEAMENLKSSSSGVCQYISYVGFNIGCWSLDENPFAYYYLITTKIGDPITPYHYQWCADWYGNAISCPLNETTYVTYECGPPGL